jgi:hypothetical protein
VTGDPARWPGESSQLESVTEVLTAGKTSLGTRRVESPLRAPNGERAMPVKILVLGLLIANLTNVMCLMRWL